MTAEPVITGREHWTTKGDVRLFLWEKRAGTTEGPLGTILFVRGSSMASQPTFDLRVPGRHDSSAMDVFARLGYDIVHHILHSFFSQPAPVYRGE
jgi:hypothetical protein